MDINKILAMEGNYKQRCVAQDTSEVPAFYISTAEIYDGFQPFETAVETPARNGGRMVIVESYATREAAAAGHARWLELARADKLPPVLQDVANSEVAALAAMLQDGLQ